MHTESNAYADANGHTFRNTECYTNSHSYAYTPANAHSQIQPSAKVSPHTRTEAIVLIYEKETHHSIRFSHRSSSIGAACLHSHCLFDSKWSIAGVLAFRCAFEPISENTHIRKACSLSASD